MAGHHRTVKENWKSASPRTRLQKDFQLSKGRQILKKIRVDPSLSPLKIQTEIENKIGIAVSTCTITRVLKKI